MIETFLESLHPDQHVLFHAIARHITDDMLDEISRADSDRMRKSVWLR